jgi:hypothetical protein
MVESERWQLRNTKYELHFTNELRPTRRDETSTEQTVFHSILIYHLRHQWTSLNTTPSRPSKPMLISNRWERKRLLNVPWLSGTKAFRLDTTILQAHLILYNQMSQIILVVESQKIASRNQLSQSTSTLEWSTRQTRLKLQKRTYKRETEDCHILIPFQQWKTG